MGVRLLCAEQSLELDGVEKLEDPLEYNLLRQTLGIAESSRELGGQLPLNMHLHYLNGVSFDKGCYIGQELT
jgi:folate-binding protein YgfZ